MKRIFFMMCAFIECCYSCCCTSLLTAESANKSLRQVVRKNFTECDSKIEELQRYASTQKDVYFRRLQEITASDDDYYGYSYYSGQVSFWNALIAYQTQKSPTSRVRLIKIAESQDFDIYQAVLRHIENSNS